MKKMKKMKIRHTINITICVILMCILSSCQSGGGSNIQCMENVQNIFPTSTVWNIPEHDYQYIVCDTSGAVYYIETFDNNSKNITSKIIIKQGR